jgi:CheY-like chemotaxis protein
VDVVIGRHELIVSAVALSVYGHVLPVEILECGEAYGGEIRNTRWRKRFVSRGHDGVTKAATLRPHIAFLDLGMPRMDGVETAKRLRTLPDGGQTILIALTGWGQEHDLQRTREAGFDHHLLKPIELQSIEELLSARIA